MPTKKKNGSKRKKDKNIEKEVTNIEQNLDNYEKAIKKINKEKEEKEKRKKIIENKIDTIREDLKNQLLSQNKFGKQFEDMIEDYIFLVKLKEELQYDISINGIRYEAKTGNGYKTDKPNESVQNLLKVNAQMLKILQDLELKAPEEGPREGEGDDLL